MIVVRIELIAGAPEGPVKEGDYFPKLTNDVVVGLSDFLAQEIELENGRLITMIQRQSGYNTLYAEMSLDAFWTAVARQDPDRSATRGSGDD
jgi:hypothetical protein